MKKIIMLLLLVTDVVAQSGACIYGSRQEDKVTLSNLTQYSEQFDNAAWTKDDTTATANAAIAPDGTLTADAFVGNGINTAHYFYPAASMSAITSGSTYRFSIYLKGNGSANYAQFYYQGASNQGVTIDLSTGQYLTSSSSVLSPSVALVGNNWWRVSFQVVATNTVLYPTISSSSTFSSTLAPSWNMTTSQLFYVWGVSVQLASSPADYLVTTAAVATRAGVCREGFAQDPYNPSKCIEVFDEINNYRTEAQILAEGRGFCGYGITSAEGTATNLLKASETISDGVNWSGSGTTITANTAVAPDGATTAETVTASAGASSKILYAVGPEAVNRPLSAGAGTQYRITGYLKRGTHRYVAFGENGDDVPRYISVDLADCTVKSTSGVIGYNNYPVGNGWCRFEVTILRTDVCGGCKNVAHQFHLVQNSGDAMSASWTAAGTETVYAWGMGLQLSSSPPDYVATTSASATRGPECGAGTAPSQYNPHFCVPVYGARREIRTPGQIYGG